MQNTPRERLMRYEQWLQGTLFGVVEEHTGAPLSDKAKLLAAVLDLIPLSRHLPCVRGWVGRPAKDRQALASAFIAKAVYGFNSTQQLVDRLRVDRQLRLLCGWNSLRLNSDSRPSTGRVHFLPRVQRVRRDRTAAASACKLDPPDPEGPTGGPHLARYHSD